MSSLAYARATSVRDAAALAREPGTEAIAGGTDLLQRLEEYVLPPARVVDITRIGGLDAIEAAGDEVRLGALVTLAEVIENPTMREDFPAIVEALSVTASPQVRNLATIGGNPFQRTRCLYFRDHTTPCNKREPGTGCAAMEGRNRINAILGGSEHCIATHPSDFAITMAALDAIVEVEGPEGTREMPFTELHREPGDTPERDTNLKDGEIVTGYRLTRRPLAARSHYLKVRDRGEFEWAICSAAVALDMGDDGRIREARIAAGGVATKPWRFPRIEEALAGAAPGAEAFRDVAKLSTEGATGHGDNDYKLTLLPRVIARALTELTEAN